MSDEEIDDKLDIEENNEKDEKDIIEKKIEKDTSIKINKKSNSVFKEDMDKILALGYDEKMIRKVYLFFKPGDINEALDYLSQKDGVYNHDFIERHGSKQKCFICDQPPENHINYESKEIFSNT